MRAIRLKAKPTFICSLNLKRRIKIKKLSPKDAIIPNKQAVRTRLLLAFKTSKPILEKWMKKQKGLPVVIKNIKDNYSDFLELLPEIPSSFRKIINLLNNDQLNLDKNLRKLDRIEKSIYKNTTRNYWMTAILIFSIFISIIIYLRVEQIHLEAIYWITGILSIIIIVMRPKKNNGK